MPPGISDRKSHVGSSDIRSIILPMRLTRRELLEIGGGIVVAGAAAPAVHASQSSTPDETEGRAADLISGYSAEGLHRTATAVDRASADRLGTLAPATGVPPLLRPFQLSGRAPV